VTRAHVPRQDATGPALIKGVVAGSLASAFPELVPGLQLSAVAGQSVDGMPFGSALKVIKGHAARPLSLTFKVPDPTHTVAKEAEHALDELGAPATAACARCALLTCCRCAAGCWRWRLCVAGGGRRI
jgi:hypothetical protein